MAQDVDLSSKEWRDLVFEGKNKEFGAYVLRAQSDKRHNKAMLITVIGVIVILILSFAYGKYNDYRMEQKEKELQLLAEQQAMAALAEEQEQPEEEEVPKQADKGKQSFNITPKEAKKKSGNDRKKYQYTKKQKQNTSQKSSNKPQPQTKLMTIRRALKTIILENSDDDSWISLANLGNHLSKRFPDFDVRNYGHKKLVTFVQSLNDFEIDRRSVSSDGKTKQLFVRIR